MTLPRPDKFFLAMLTTVALASVLPAQGAAKSALDIVTYAGVAFCFFLHGANLSREAVIAGLSRWKLHAGIFTATFVLFPVLGLLIGLLPAAVLSPALAMGILYLCCLPSTVVASVGFTAIAGGNVPAAVCSASASNLIGVFLTPALVGFLMHAQGDGITFDTVRGIFLQLLLPFVAGQALRRRIAPFISRHKKVIGLVDRSAILLVVYGAFGTAVLQGLWSQLSPSALVMLLAIEALLLAFVLCFTWWVARRLGFDRADSITAMFCGSKKSLASGVPMAGILFAGQAIGTIVLPLMLFHQMQLMVCSMLAQRFAQAAAAEKRAALAMGSAD